MFLPAGLFYSTTTSLTHSSVGAATSHPGSLIPVVFPQLTMATMDDVISLKKKKKKNLTVLSSYKAIQDSLLPVRCRPNIGVGHSSLQPPTHFLPLYSSLRDLSMDSLMAEPPPLFLKDFPPRDPLTHPTSPPNSYALPSI